MRNRLKILLADDSDEDVFFFQRAVERTGVKIHARVVQDGQEAIDYIKGEGRFSDRDKYPLPALIILDLKMPKLNGFDVLNWVRSRPKYSRTPVLMLSTSDDARDVDRAYALGANAYLTKPGPHGDMPEMIRTIDNFWRQYAILPQSRD